MKTLLYNVSHREDMKNIGFVPLAYVLLEEYLRKMEPDMEFFRYDYIPDDPEAKEFENYFHYDLVGFQLTYPNINVVLEMVERWHKAEDKPFVVLGGVLASAIAFELVENHQFIDAVVIGEGEESLLQLTHYLEGKIELSQVPGIVYRDQQDKATFNRGKRPIDFDLTAIPKRDYLAQLPQEEARRTSVRIQSARGCLGGCSFCMNSYKNRLDKVTTKSWRGMSPQRVIQEIESLYHRFGIQIINFVDPSFEDPGKRGKERIAEIAKLLVEKDLRISFKVNMRAETFTDNDIELLKLLKKAGMDIIILGIEASTNQELKLFGKNADIKTATQAYWRLQNMDSFFVLVGFIAVHPYATLETLKKSYDYVNSIGKSYSFNIFNCVLIPLRGTNIYDRMLNDGLIINPHEVLAVPKYKFKDPQVARINEGIQHLKINHPILTQLNKTIFDALNIKARSTNRIISDMLHNPVIEKKYRQFCSNFSQLCQQLSDSYYQLQMDMLDMAANGWDIETFAKMAEKVAVKKAHKLYEQLDFMINDYISTLKDNGVDTAILEFKSWGSYCQEKIKISV